MMVTIMINQTKQICLKMIVRLYEKNQYIELNKKYIDKRAT